MDIKEVSIRDIKPYDRNPRRNDPAVNAVAKSIKEFGFRQPIVVDKDGVIIVGHTRYKAAKKLGMKTVPVHYADLSEQQAKAYRLADNKTNELADWDFDLLGEELDGILDFDMADFGFDLAGSTEKEWQDLRKEGRGSLSSDYIEPPFSVLDTTSGRWQKRKDVWRDLGVCDSGVRKEGLIGEGLINLAKK